jgi:hypothetical protein
MDNQKNSSREGHSTPRSCARGLLSSPLSSRISQCHNSPTNAPHYRKQLCTTGSPCVSQFLFSKPVRREAALLCSRGAATTLPGLACATLRAPGGNGPVIIRAQPCSNHETGPVAHSNVLHLYPHPDCGHHHRHLYTYESVQSTSTMWASKEVWTGVVSDFCVSDGPATQYNLQVLQVPCGAMTPKYAITKTKRDTAPAPSRCFSCARATVTE